ncbi:MAG: hypothetical protein KatS3mg111_0575 [Pirellulaceae bacterium]|nr:MAG: hypothetical protein KatS3mg111_0575 [Pirellulaceae bacterium]
MTGFAQPTAMVGFDYDVFRPNDRGAGFHDGGLRPIDDCRISLQWANTNHAARVTGRI